MTEEQLLEIEKIKITAGWQWLVTDLIKEIRRLRSSMRKIRFVSALADKNTELRKCYNIARNTMGSDGWRSIPSPEDYAETDY